MSPSDPRLLVTLAAEPALTSVLDRALPGIPWGYLDAVPPEHRDAAEALLVGSFRTGLGEVPLTSLPRLAFIQRIYTGIDGFPFDRVPAQVRVAGNVGAFAPFVSEHAVALALGAARELPRALEAVRAGRLRPPPVQRVLYGSTVTILGFGEIGRAIAVRVRPFGARVVGVARTDAPRPDADTMFAADHLLDAVGPAQFVFEVRPLTARTRGTLGAREFGAMRPDAVFVNVGRAATVDEEALYHHLRDHPDFRAAIDVWWEENHAAGTLSSRFPFATLPNFLGTPHSAGYAPGADARAGELAVENLVRYFRDGKPEHVVDRSEYESPPAPGDPPA